MEQRIFELSEYFAELRARKDDLKDKLKDLEAELKSIESELVQAMVDEETQSFTRGGKQFILVNKVYPSAIPETKQELYDILKGQGYESLFTINSQTLSSSVKQWREEAEYDPDRQELVELIDPYIRTEEQASISIRKSKK